MAFDTPNTVYQPGKWMDRLSSAGEMDSLPGVISRGAQGGGAPLVKISAHVGGSAPLKLLHWLGFSESIGLASKVL